MKYLGIDYGTKKVGIAISDDGGMIAFPRTILQNTEKLVEEIFNYIQEENIQRVIIGKSLNSEGEHNVVQKNISQFITALSEKLNENIEIIEQDERGSSIAARSHLYGKGNIANERWTSKGNEKKRQQVDAHAAAVILQRYLDTQSKKNL